jgi:hypothetical protein
VFIPARITDNVHLRGGEYERSLAALPEASRKALLEGRWDVFEGAVFEWDPRVHVCQPFPIPVEWEMWRGADDGFAQGAAILWMTRDEIYDRVFVVQELYASGMTPEVMARAVLRIDRSIPINMGDGEIISNDCPLDGVIDSASFADVGLGGETGRGGRADIMNALGCRWTPSPKGAGSRVAGVSAIHQRLALQRDGHPGLVVFNTCRNLVRTLPALCYSKSHPEDVDTDSEDHLFDALRYALTRHKISGGMVKVRWAH